MKIDLHASAVKEEDMDDEEIHESINKFSELEIVF